MTKLGGAASKSRIIFAGSFAALLIGTLFFVAATPHIFLKPEVAELSKVSWTMPQYEDYFTKLAKEKGGLYAFSVLTKVDFSSNIDTHLLGHDVGYVYYDQAGIQGITNCTHELADACIHALVTEEFLTGGPNAYRGMADYCLTYSPDSVTYANCFHGIGHGILAYLKYDFPSAIGECKTMYDYVLTQRSDAALRDVYGECVGGVTMELMQGKHDAAAYAAEKPIYLPPDDPLAPCDRAYVPAEVKLVCYLHMNGRLIGAGGGNADNTYSKDDVYKKALGFCKDVPDLADRRACYGSLGSSFLYQVADGDAAKFVDITEDSMRKTYRWCSFAEDPDSVGACILTAAEVLLGGGERGTRLPARYCELVPDPVIKDHCYADLLVQGRRYLPLLMLDTLCPLLPEPYKSECYAPL